MTRTAIKSASLTLALGLALSACGQKPAPAPVGNLAVAEAPATEIAAIAALLDQGNDKEARKRLRGVLKTSPNDPEAQLLRDSIERDAKELLGPESYPYVVKPGETMSGLAQRLLGNRLKAYQLARYNGIAVPASLAAGTTIRIPGTPPRPPAPRPEPAKPAPTPAKPRPAAPDKPAPKPTSPTATAPARPAANPAAAQRARAAGLAALNAGNVNAALAQLRRAAALDPGNAVIARDLARAERIAATVRARR